MCGHGEAQGRKEAEAGKVQDWAERVGGLGEASRRELMIHLEVIVCLLPVFQFGESLARLRFLVGQATVGRREELLVKLDGLGALMQIVIRRCLEEERRREKVAAL